jgi:hypothetical protein
MSLADWILAVSATVFIVAALIKWHRPILCFMGEHDWTSAADQGEEPTPEQLAAGVAGFWDYARMYCKHCDKTYTGGL